MKVKICGLYRKEDIEYINTYKPDYCGFIIDFPKSHRNVSVETLKDLSSLVDSSIQRVGVFVNEDIDIVISLLKDDVIDIAQLHGKEDEQYIASIKKEVDKPIIKFYKVQSKEDVIYANQSKADFILLDNGTGTGKTFDWTLLQGINRDYFLAGGINIENIEEAMILHPYALDISSGVETNKIKDEKKIKDIISLVRKEN